MKKYLTVKEIEGFGQKLLKRKRELWQEVRGQLRMEVAEEYQDMTKVALDEEDRAVVDLKEETVLSLIEPKKNELEEIEEALLRIERGEYGICIDCSGSIGFKRLELMPETPRCAPCQSAREQARRK